MHWCVGTNQYNTRVARFHRSADSGVANGKFGGPIEKPNEILVFPRIAPPPDPISVDTNDAVPWVLKTLWPLSLKANDQRNCIYSNNNVMHVLLSYLFYNSKLRIKHFFHERRRQQHLYFKTRACSQRLRKAYHHWLWRKSGRTVNKVRGIEKEIIANYWKQKYPNGTL